MARTNQTGELILKFPQMLLLARTDIANHTVLTY